MYDGGQILGTVTPLAATTATAFILPNTGVGSSIVTYAVAVLVGLLTWGIMYAHANR